MGISPEFQQQYAQALQGIQNNPAMQPLSSDMIQKVVGMGGGLSSSLGFNDPGSLAGLTPQQFNEVIANRSNIMNENTKQLSDSVNIANNLYGIPQAREAAMKAAGQQFEANVQDQLQGQRLTSTEKTAQAQLDEEKRYHDLVDQHNTSTLGEITRHNQADEDHANKVLAATTAYQNGELAARNKYYDLLGDKVALQRATASQNWAGKEEANLMATRAKVADSKVGDRYEQSNTLFNTDILLHSLRGDTGAGSVIPIPSSGGTLNSITGGYVGSAAKTPYPGYESLVRDSNGDWHGVKTVDGKQKVSQDVLIANPMKNQATADKLYGSLKFQGFAHQITPMEKVDAPNALQVGQ